MVRKVSGRKVSERKVQARKVWLAACAALIAGAGSGAAEGKRVVIGSGTVDLSGSGHAIDVSQAPGAFRGIRLRAKSGPIAIDRVQIVYGGGAVHTERTPIALRKNGETPPIHETSADSFIDSVTIVAKPGNGRVAVEVLGIQTEDGARRKRGAPIETAEAETRTPAPADNAEHKPTATERFNDIMFGYQTVGFGIDREVIRIGREVGKFNRIRLRVRGSDLHVNGVKVTFENGATQHLPIDADIKAETYSPWLAIDGNEFIRDIELTYLAHPGRETKARVEVTGEYARGWLGLMGEGRKYHQGWVLLGAQTAGFTGFDRDVINVGENEGGFARLRIEAVDRAITLREIRVKYASGPDEVFTMRERIDPGKPYGPIEFKSGSLPIKSIEARYRSRFDLGKGLKNALDGRPAVVQIWGQH